MKIGTPIANYGGHNHRVFRVEFSPENPDSVFSIAEENCVHEWKISKLVAKTPKESAGLIIEFFFYASFLASFLEFIFLLYFFINIPVIFLY